MSKISSKIFLLILSIFIITLINGLLIIFYFINSSNDTIIINKLAELRGLIQRATLLILNNNFNEAVDAVDTIDALFENFAFYNKRYYFIISTQSLQNNINNIREKWENLKTNFNNYKINQKELIKNQIIKNSEDLWIFTDHTVLIAEHRAENLKKRLQVTFYVISLNILLILIIFWISKILIKDKLEYFANYDSVTNTLNRSTFYSYLSNLIKVSKRYKKLFCLIMFDIDYFKRINDSYGHQVGDEILKSITAIIKKEIRETDLLARFGGDEFLILAPEINIKKGIIIAEKIRKSIEINTLFNDIKTTISLGITEFKSEDTIDSIVNRTDQALYKSKSKGRNSCSVL